MNALRVVMPLPRITSRKTEITYGIHNSALLLGRPIAENAAGPCVERTRVQKVAS